MPRLYLVHHGEAVGPEVDPRRPLSALGERSVDLTAAAAAARDTKPSVIWHSGKLRAKQTAEAYWRACNPLAMFSASRDLQPSDPPEWMRDRLRFEPRDILLAGHYPHLPQLLAVLLGAPSAAATFPIHGIVALVSDDDGTQWRELWRLDAIT